MSIIQRCQYTYRFIANLINHLTISENKPTNVGFRLITGRDRTLLMKFEQADRL